MEHRDGTAELCVFAGFDVLLDALPGDALILVDMPIGLPERIRGAGRACEAAARMVLGARRSSVFPIPARGAVERGAGPFANSAARRLAHADSSRLARSLSDPPRGVSIQGFGLFPKIMEIDRLLRAEPGRAGRVLESHPELVFALLAGEPCRWPKSVTEGLAERRSLLRTHGLPPTLLEAPRPPGVAEDDRLDACALLLAARHAQAGTIRRFPDPPERDGHGLPIAIHA